MGKNYSKNTQVDFLKPKSSHASSYNLSGNLEHSYVKVNAAGK